MTVRSLALALPPLVAVRRDDLQALVWHADDNWADEPEGVQVLQRVEAALVERTPGDGRQRVATPALGASLVWHYLSDVAVRGVQKALCGEGHRDWWALSRFVDGNAFRPCAECVRIGGGDDG